MKTPLTRTYYYQGELLALADFIRDQQYFRDLNALQNKHLYSPGVVSGMTLTAIGNVLKVDPGLGYDSEGIPLASANVMTRDVTAETLPAGTYPVGVSYSDSIMTSQGTQSLQGSHRIDEQPVLIVVKASPPGKPFVTLGSVTIGTEGKIMATDDTGRELAQLRIASKSAPQPPPSSDPRVGGTPSADAGHAPPGPVACAADQASSGTHAVAQIAVIGVLVDAVKILARRVEALEVAQARRQGVTRRRTPP